MNKTTDLILPHGGYCRLRSFVVALAAYDGTVVFDEPLLSALRVLETATAEVSANILLCLTHQASYLLKCQMERLETEFVEKGGFTERLYQYRKEHRGAGNVKEATLSDQSDPSEF